MPTSTLIDNSRLDNPQKELGIIYIQLPLLIVIHILFHNIASNNAPAIDLITIVNVFSFLTNSFR